MKESAVRRGFTLVELLIVIVVIGILSAMMMLSSTEAVSSARAADIISDLRNLKTAALAWYADNLDEIEALGNQDAFPGEDDVTQANEAKIWQYMGNANNADKIQGYGGGKHSDYKYSFGSRDDRTNMWYVWCRVNDDMNVRKKLAARASSVGLVGASSPRGSHPECEVFDANEKDKSQYVGLRIK